MDKLTFTLDTKTGAIIKEEAMLETEIQQEMFEKVLKQLIKTTVEEVSNNNRLYKELEHYPPVLQAHHIEELTGFSKTTVYEILHSEGCPKFQKGKRMVTPRDEFWRFFINRSLSQEARHE